MNTEELEKVHRYRLRILITCCALYGAVGGIIISCNGQFYASVAEALSVPLGSVTLGTTFLGLATVVGTGFFVRAYRRFNPRLVVTLAVLLYALGAAGPVFCTKLWQYYAFCILRGFEQPFLIYFITAQVTRAWYPERPGFALGLTVFFAGFVGIGANSVITFVIENAGWRVALLGSCMLTFLLAMPCLWLFFYRTPQEWLGQGVQDTPQAEKKKSAVPGSFPVFLAGLATVVLFVIPYSYTYHLKVFAQGSGFDQVAAGLTLSFCMGGNLAFKFLLSMISDRIGTRRSAELIMVSVLVGFLLLLLPQTRIILYAAAFFLGASAGMSAVLSPQVTGMVYRGEDYEAVYSKYSSGLSLGGAVYTSVIGAMYSATGSYRPAFLAGIGLLIVCALLMYYFIAHPQSEGLRKEEAH